EEDVVVADRRVGGGDDGVDVAREDEARPRRHEGYVGLRIVEDGTTVRTRDQRRMEREPELGAVKPIERDLGREKRLGDVETGPILELMAAAVEAPHLEDQSVAEGTRDQVPGEDPEGPGAA